MYSICMVNLTNSELIMSFIYCTIYIFILLHSYYVIICQISQPYVYFQPSKTIWFYFLYEYN